mmetsp:Transcript_65442/g.122060  ORF Transcript_65442/g.122060 Transcript_65442/m.122060 type:complete len:749 (-) Transcript_65442:118-2364(-)
MATTAAGQRVATIEGVDSDAVRWTEGKAYELAAEAANVALDSLCAAVAAAGGGQLLLLRALHHLSRRLTLAHLAAAAREADLNDPSKSLHEQVAAPVALGIERRLVDLAPTAGTTLAATAASPAKVIMRPGKTYVFYSSASGSTVVSEFLTNSGIRINLDNPLDGSNSLNPCGLGVLKLPTGTLPVFVKEKQVNVSGPIAFENFMRRVAIEVGTCAALAPLQCFIRVCAVQVHAESVWLAFERLQGQTIDELLDAAESQSAWANEQQIMGALLLSLQAYCTLSSAGYCQRDVKSSNLWLSKGSDGRIKVTIIDSDACSKVGHIMDARMHGYTSEGWQLKAVADKEVWRFGGAGNTCTVHAANLDLISKQCVCGEQAVIFSLTEIALRLMGKSDIVWKCDDETQWQDLLDSTVHCNLFDNEKQSDVGWLGAFGMRRVAKKPHRPQLPKVEPMRPQVAPQAPGNAQTDAASMALIDLDYISQPEETEFAVNLSRTGIHGASALLGLEVADGLEGEMLIAGVKPGLVQVWNSTHPERAVRQGDRIIKVNGYRNDAIQFMKDELARSPELNLLIARTEAGRKKAEASKPAPATQGSQSSPVRSPNATLSSSTASGGSSRYSQQFLHLMMSLRRRTFTQGGADACMDLTHSRTLCRDYVEQQLGVSEDVCILAFSQYAEAIARQGQGQSWLKGALPDLAGLPALTEKIAGSWGKAAAEREQTVAPLAAAAEFWGQQFQSMAERMTGAAGSPKR